MHHGESHGNLRLNERTALAHRREVFEPNLGHGVDEANALAVWRRLVAQREARGDRAAVAVVMRWRSTLGVDTVQGQIHCIEAHAEVPIALVLGRHSSCDSPALPGASLRHALLLAWPSVQGEPPRIEILDLKTDVGIGVPGGAAAHLESMGPLRFGVGAADVVVIGVRAGEPLCTDLREIMRRFDGTPPPVRRWRSGAGAGASLTTVLRWHAGLEAAALRSSDREANANDDEHRRRSHAEALRHHGTIITRISGTAEPDERPVDEHPLVIRASWRDLEEGLLLGRYERCTGHEDAARDERVSRVHACLLLRRGRLFVVDLASTNGTLLQTPGTSPRHLGDGERAARVRDTDELWLHEKRCMVLLEERPALPRAAEQRETGGDT